MLKRLLSKLTGDRQQIERHLKNQYRAEENGLSFPQSLVDDPELWALASWLEQLAEEDYLISLTDRWLLSWEALYHLLEDEEHASSLPLIGIPEVLPLRASMSSRGALSDKDFRVWIAEWTTLPHVKLSVSAAPGLFLLMKTSSICYHEKTGRSCRQPSS
ncbi:hypothetical protein LNO36_05650 [Klebsiella variicola subsp. variicola]|nr:hypothetical protein [Klebsiella variicola subsp. variicola]